MATATSGTTPSASPPKTPDSISTTAHGPRRSPEAILVEVTRQLADLRAQLGDEPHYEPGLPLTSEHCQRIEATTGLGSTQTPLRLCQAIERLAAVSIGEIRIPFTPGQLAELQHRAGKRGRTIEQELRAVVDRIQDELFYKGG